MPRATFATSGLDLAGCKIDNERLVLIKPIASGAYGVVYLALDRLQNVNLAVKCLLRAGLDSRQRHFQRREVALHQLASRHTGVVTLHKVLEEGDFIFVVMDFYEEGDLFGNITERQRYIGNDELIRHVFLQIIDAVDYCHSLGIFHRDLKPENILVREQGTRVCIADFGLATSERVSTDLGCGSTFYLSPECQGGLHHRVERYSTEHNDLWSLGVILVNLTCGRNPWRQATLSDDTFRAYCTYQDFLRTILPLSHQAHIILQGLFALEPSARTPLRVLRQQILEVTTFTMTEEELRHAQPAARAAAVAVRPRPEAPSSLDLRIPPFVPREDRPVASAASPLPQQRLAEPARLRTDYSPPAHSPESREAGWSQESAYEDMDADVPMGDRSHSGDFNGTPGSTRSSDVITPMFERRRDHKDSLAPPGASSSSSSGPIPRTPPSYPVDRTDSQEWRPAPRRKLDDPDVQQLEDAFPIEERGAT